MTAPGTDWHRPAGTAAHGGDGGLRPVDLAVPGGGLARKALEVWS